MSFHKTSIVLDEKKLDFASEILNTKSKRDTVDAALDEVIRKDRIEKLIDLSVNQTHVDPNRLDRVREEGWH